jgi:hypothetical protein
MHASSLQWLEDFILASSVLCNLLAYANGRRMKYGCMFEILGKRQDKSAILTYIFAKEFLVPFDVQHLKSNLQQPLNRTHILNAAPSSMQFQDRVQQEN